MDKEDFKFISDITEVNNVMLGGTNRQGTVAYPFGGTINSAQIYQSVLSDEELKILLASQLMVKIFFMKETLQIQAILEFQPCLL